MDSEIPPTVACAICGRSDCEGCQENPAEQTSSESPLAWEQTGRSHRERLWETTRATTNDAEVTFRALAREAVQVPPAGSEPRSLQETRSAHEKSSAAEKRSAQETRSVATAFNYAFVAEFWAVLSWTIPWALGFSLLFPRLTWHMISSPLVLALGFAILLLLVLGVVAIHMWWGLAVEWGVSRTGTRASLPTGLRFGLYACGWDLMTSPAGLVTHILRDGWRRGLAQVRMGAQVPRTAVNTYLVGGRSLSEAARRTALWTAIWITTAGLLLALAAVFGAIALWMLRDL